MNLVNTPEARRALAALALLDSESGKLRQLGLPTRRAVSAIESFCVTAGDLAVFPLSELSTPAREELANVREAQSGMSRTVPMSGAAASEKSAASDSAAPASRSSPARGSEKPNDRSIPSVSASSAELRRSNDRHSTTPPRQIFTGSGFSPDNDLLEAEGQIGKPHRQQVKNTRRVDPTIGNPMKALSQLVHKIEAKKVSGKGVRRDDGAMHSAQRTTRTRPERTAERHTDRSNVSTYQSSAPKGSGSIQSTGNHLERHFADSSPFHPSSDAASDSFVPYFAGTETNSNTESTEESKFVEELANNAPDQKGAVRSLPFSSTAGFPVGQRISGEFPQSAAGSDAYDPGEQLADLINAALQAQARRRGIS